jgi:drug/metabolite transporter (DMT)-like permease
MTALSVALALLAACSNAVSNVLQRKANLQEPSDRALSLRLVAHLARNRLWLGGIGAVILSFGLQAVALGTGSLAIVQPIIVLELPLTLILASRTLGSPLRGSEFAGIAVMAAGLILVLVGLDPRGAVHSTVAGSSWVIGLLVTFGVVVLLVVAGTITSGSKRAMLFGAATGIEFGMTATLTKGMTNAFASGGFSGALSSWTTYAMVAAGLLGMFLLQNALQAGRLVASQPGITLLDPVTAVAWGVLAFHETVNGGAWWTVTAAGAAAMVTGVFVLVESPSHLSVHSEERRRGEPSQTEPIHGTR